MPSFERYKERLGRKGQTLGEVRKQESDMIMEATWDGDINSKIGWFYDQVHDSEFEIVTDLHPEDTEKIPIPVKHFEMEYNSLAKDEVSHHIMFKPSNDITVPYYEKVFEKPYGAIFPIGLYVDLTDEGGTFRRWLVVGEYRAYSNQFVSFLVLPCDHKLQWIYKNQKFESWGVLRSQSSYNSGVWIDFKVTSPENQKIIWLPMNEKTKTLFYDQRVIISQPREEPLCWKVSKVEDMNVKGIVRITFAQDRFDQHTDFIEKDEEGAIIGMWANYFTINNTEPTPSQNTQPEPSAIRSEITYSGPFPQLKVGGSYKRLTVHSYDEARELKYKGGSWEFEIDGKDANNLITTLLPDQSKDLDENEIKVKFTGDDTYIGDSLTVRHIGNNGTQASITLDIVGL